MSPGGIITLSTAARKSLGMRVNEPAKLSVQVDKEFITISAENPKQSDSLRVSKKGQMELPDAAKEFLSKSKERHYWMELFDERHEVRLYPF